jgi:hypothetical protein
MEYQPKNINAIAARPGKKLKNLLSALSFFSSQRIRNNKALPNTLRKKKLPLFVENLFERT